MPTTRLQTRLGKGAPLLAGLPTPTRRPRVARAPRPMLLPVLAPVELVDVWDEESNGSSLSAAPEGLLTPSPPASRASSSALSSPPPSISSASSSAPSSSMADTHRLVAPGQEDILLTPEEHVKVLDFIRGMRQGLQSPRAASQHDSDPGLSRVASPEVALDNAGAPSASAGDGLRQREGGTYKLRYSDFSSSTEGEEPMPAPPSTVQGASASCPRAAPPVVKRVRFVLPSDEPSGAGLPALEERIQTWSREVARSTVRDSPEDGGSSAGEASGVASAAGEGSANLAVVPFVGPPEEDRVAVAVALPTLGDRIRAALRRAMAYAPVVPSRLRRRVRHSDSTVGSDAGELPPGRLLEAGPSSPAESGHRALDNEPDPDAMDCTW